MSKKFNEDSDDSSSSAWEEKFTSDDYSESSDEEESSYESSSSQDSDDCSHSSLESTHNKNHSNGNGIRNRRKNNSLHYQQMNPLNSSKEHKIRLNSRRHSQQHPLSILCLYKMAFKSSLSKRSTHLLLFSCTIWLFVQFAPYNINTSSQHVAKDISLEESVMQLKNRRKSAMDALGEAAGYKQKKKKHKSNDTHEKIDKLPKDCHPYSWHSFTFPTSNIIHEIDLEDELRLKRHGPVIPADLGEGDKSSHSWDKVTARKMGFLGSGLWRQSWRVNPRMDVDSSVLKMMKNEHPIDQRNFDRHRRDALVMERLTTSPNVVSIYGFCGNTVLTEYGGMTLDEYLYDDVEIVTKYDRNTAMGKLQLVLEVMKGIEALHEIDDGPILHADIQAKQFLFDPVTGIKVNDFNRCRFLPKNNVTGETCKLKIPSAPGGTRSPEEYELMKLDEKIDIYSTANILYGILTGKKPWDGKLKKETRKNVINGIKPFIHERYRKPGTIEAVLAEIIDNAYSLDSNDRWSARIIVEKLEAI